VHIVNILGHTSGHIYFLPLTSNYSPFAYSAHSVNGAVFTEPFTGRQDPITITSFMMLCKCFTYLFAYSARQMTLQEVCRSLSECIVSEWTDIQTDRHTDRQTYRRTEMMLIAILRTSAKRSKQLTSIQSNSAKTRITAAYTQSTEPRLQHGRTYAMQTRTGTFESISSRLKTLE